MHDRILALVKHIKYVVSCLVLKLSVFCVRTENTDALTSSFGFLFGLFTHFLLSFGNIQYPMFNKRGEFRYAISTFQEVSSIGTKT